jgi:hypothetical protein
LHPRRELVSPDRAAGEAKHDFFLLIDRGRDLKAVQQEHDLESRMSNALVAIDERVVVAKKEPQCGCLFNDGRIKILTIERLERLADRRMQRRWVANTF